MDLGMTERVKPLVEQVRRMVADEIAPLDAEFHAEVGKHPSGDRFKHTERQLEILHGLKAKARERGLWNFWLTDSDRGYGLSTVEYAYLAEEMGKVAIAAEVFNCNAPDTGNMEVLERYGAPWMKERWLGRLLEGEIRSAYVMTEPDVASSDAAQLVFEARRDGDDYVLNGEKWWISGAGDPRCGLYILMACTDPGASKHARHTMFVMDPDTPGIEILRPMQVFGQDDAPHGHMHLRFTDVRIPASHVVLGEARGFEVAQGRLGPGRIHHCMRAIGQAEKALALMCQRGLAREAFGKPLADLGGNYDILANARMEIEMARLLCLKAAWMMDTQGVRAAQPWISKIKVIAPLMAGKVIDEAMQLHGAAGISQDMDLAHMWTHVRTLRFADGPDAVHRRQVARAELRKHAEFRAMTEEERASVAVWMAAHVDGFEGPLSAEKFDVGQSNPTYRLTSPSGTYVLRRKPPGTLLKSAHAVDREFRVQAALAETGVPVPKMLALCEDERVLGTVFYVMDHVAGRNIADPSMPGLAPPERRATMDAMNRVLAAIHAVDVEAVGLADYGPSGNYYERQLARWAKQYRASQTDDIADMTRLMDQLGQLMPADDGRRGLVHGDYRIDNLLFAPETPECVAVLDWELSTLGHPFADLAGVIMQWQLPPGPEGRGLAGLDRTALGLPGDADFVASYCARRGIDRIEGFGFYVAFAFFRMAAILQGVKKRALDGNASNPEKALRLGAFVPRFAELGLEAFDAHG